MNRSSPQRAGRRRLKDCFGPKAAPSAAEIDDFVSASKTGDLAGLARFAESFGTRYLDVKDAHGDTALTRAARANQIEAVHFLLEKGAKVDGRNSHRGTALMDAAVGGHVDVIKDLLSHGADVTLKSYAHMTAHWYAAVNKHTEAAALIADAPRQRQEAAVRVTAETVGSLTEGSQQAITVAKPLRFTGRPASFSRISAASWF